MAVGADLHRAGRLSLVAKGVHVADDRVADLVVGLGEDVHRPDIGHLVDGGHERDHGPGHVGDAVRPDTAGDDDVPGLDGALVGDDTGDRPIAGVGTILGEDVEHLGVGEHPAADHLDGLPAHGGAGLERVDDRDGRAVEATQDHVLVDEGDEFFHTGRGEHVGLDAPCHGGGHAPVEFVHALLGAGHLDTAGVDRELHVPELVGALLAEQGHLLVVVDGEDEVGGVAGGAARIG